MTLVHRTQTEGAERRGPLGGQGHPPTTYFTTISCLWKDESADGQTDLLFEYEPAVRCKSFDCKLSETDFACLKQKQISLTSNIHCWLVSP